ncbi:hypothetical protein CQ018_17175 [Arthrobacter sp. MYb227]|uniref:hypothetical protein n=1 Tax=Arthrobacter sp. MYb227 TaxID=1848601 RepID=UPI000CFCACD7|nr:hypothetical protein [Arthrobacter sp. MYb227]PQZ88175.1 hypothetical protein CQ018_17175 [Arthrobacter sp. MYb227]
MLMSQPSDAQRDAKIALENIEAAANQSVRQVAGPRWFARIIVLVFSGAQALFHVTPIWVPLGLITVVLCVGTWFYLYPRASKPRTSLGQSAAYGWWFLLLLLITQFANFWHADTWWQVGLKFVLLVLVLGFIMNKMLVAERLWRIKDANEQAH